MKCGCSIPNDKKSTSMLLPNGGKVSTKVVYHGTPKKSPKK